MCDYSLHNVNNRLAKEGESLIVHKFPGISKGLASPADLAAATQIRPAPKGTHLFGRLIHWAKERRRVGSPDATRKIAAVCIPPGARLYVEGIPEDLQVKYAVGEAAEVTFTQLTAEPFRYRDALRFASGDAVIVQKFDEGTRVEVLSLALEEDPEEEEEAEPAEVEEPAPAPAIVVERSMRANA